MTELVEILGKDKKGYQYVLCNDLFVYQFKDLKCIGSFCSLATWSRALHKIID